MEAHLTVRERTARRVVEEKEEKAETHGEGRPKP
jgi:hypothetical protein